ncbi:MAG: ROK family protein [Lewinellaceae bacterium]|nr:ROK family protein [Saprospiraceae bacterium]MCB9339771.1 ROK family protein [Lewinellaceae bacterium]
MQTNNILGIDVGASGIKGAIVDLEIGDLTTERLKLDTPQPSNTTAMAETVAELVRQIGYEGELIGCGFPAVVKKGVSHSAANIDDSWKGANIEEIFSRATGKRVLAVNDADAAGLAEMKYGKGKGLKGSVLLITIGSGLGSALFTNGHLVQNTEFGHCNLHDGIAEHYVSNLARKRHDMSWEVFGLRFNEFLEMIERTVNPDLIILGGGVSNRYELFSEWISIETEVTTAEMFNNAGIVGAAQYAFENQ